MLPYDCSFVLICHNRFDFAQVLDLITMCDKVRDNAVIFCSNQIITSERLACNNEIDKLAVDSKSK